MNQIIIENLEPLVLEKLKNQADNHGRSLQEELKFILKSAVLPTSPSVPSVTVIPLEELEQEVKESLLECGYNSPEKIVELVQDVKKEIARERGLL
jgi:plasmid stability protein